MRQIVFSTFTYDLEGSLSLEILPESDLATFSRRVTRSATLDGGGTITDEGYSDSDRTISLVARIEDENIISNLIYLFQNYTRILFISDNAYEAYFVDLKNDFGLVTLRLYLKGTA